MSERIATVSDESNIDLPKGIPFQKGKSNRLLIRAGLKVAGIAARWPMETRTVFPLLKIIGYDANRSRLDYCLIRGYLTAPTKEGGQYVWTESNAVSFADALESLRAWLPMHPCHTHKYSTAEMTQARMVAISKKTALQEFTALPLVELIDFLVGTEDLETRELLAIALKEQIGTIHIRGAETEAEPLSADSN